MSDEVVEPCASCARHVRASERCCPFCGAPHVSEPRPAPPRAPTRAALAAWAGLVLGACGGGGAAGDDVAPEGSSGGEGAEGDAEASCAGHCGSHHRRRSHPPCMDDPEDPCPAPPYGAPPADELLV